MKRNYIFWFDNKIWYATDLDDGDVESMSDQMIAIYNGWSEKF